MALRVLAAIGLLILGAILRVPVVAILGLVLGVVEVAHWIWLRRGLRAIRYRRSLDRDRITWGEELDMTVDVWNQGALPMPWLRADDAASDGLVVRGRGLLETDDAGLALRNTWTLGPYEHVIRHLSATGERRGVYTIGPATLTGSDLLVRQAAMEERSEIDTFLVRPRTLTARGLSRPDRWGDLDRSRTGLAEDPARFAGIRPYSPGDPLRRIHPRASARLGRPVVKRYEPSRERDVLLVVDLRIGDGPAWELAVADEEVESLFVVAASLARALAAEHAAFGIAAAGFTGAPSRFAELDVSEAPGQLDRVLDLLARLSSHPSASFDALLERVRRRTRPGTTILIVTARDARRFGEAFRRLRRTGFGVSIVTAGPDAVALATAARSSGLTARSAVMDAPWRTATTLAIGA